LQVALLVLALVLREMVMPVPMLLAPLVSVRWQ
jgi:hypothetical protein